MNLVPSPLRSLVPSLLTALLLAGVAARAQTPLLHYTFDDLTDPTADSGSGTAAPGSLDGASQFTLDTPGGFSAGAFDTNGGAEGSRVSGGDAAKLDGLSDFTITLWVNLQGSLTAQDRLVGKRNAAIGSEPHFEFFIETPAAGTFSATDLRLRLLFDNGPTNASSFSVDTSLPIDDWIFLAVTYAGAGAAGSAIDFFRGTETTMALQLGQSTDPAGIGAIPNNSGAFLVADADGLSADRTPDAFFDDVRVYGSVLTGAQIEDVRLANLVVPEPGSALLALCGGAALLLRRRR